MSRNDWESISTPGGGLDGSGNGTYVDRLSVPGGYLYSVEEWGSGAMEGRLEHRCVVFVPEPEVA